MERLSEALTSFLSPIVDLANEWVINIGPTVNGETVPLMVILLLGVGFYLTVRTGFVQLSRLGHGFGVTTGRYDDPNDPGDVSHFQALTTALSATVGIGNIAGVALAIHWGGPGALFWMWVTAGLGMATKYSEVTLAQKYRVTDEAGTVAGGPMYYIERGLGPRWKPVAIFFAVMLGLTAFLTGNAVQANTIADQLNSTLGISTIVAGLVTATIVGLVILGGISRIGRVTSVLAPVMAAIYVFGALLIIAFNLSAVPGAFGTIFTEAFNPSAGIAGVGTGVFLITLMWGVRRGLFSNEAGQGSAPIAHAAAKTEEPVSEGVVALLEPFIDTIVICTLTGLVIVMTGTHEERFPTELTLAPGSGDMSYVMEEENGRIVGADEPAELSFVNGVHAGAAPEMMAWHEVAVEPVFVDEDQTTPFSGTFYPDRGEAVGTDGAVHTSLFGNAVESGAPLTAQAFREGLSPLGDWGHYIVLFGVLLFGISTAIAWSYYGDRCAYYLLGARAVVWYKWVFLLAHFAGASISLAVVWAVGDLMLAIVIWPNLVALFMLAPVVVKETKSYFARQPWIAQAERHQAAKGR